MTSRLRRLGPRSVLAVLLASLVLVPAMLVSPASATAPKKLYGADISPHTVPPNSTTLYTFMLTNEAKSPMIGSANLTAPTGFTIPSGQVLTVSPRGKATVVGNRVELRSLGLMSGETATLTFMATSASAPSVYTWVLEVKQANDFRGAGNTFAPDTATTHLMTTVGTGGGVSACLATEPCSGTATDGAGTSADVQVDPGATPAVLTVTLLPTDAIACTQEGEGGPTPYVGTSATVDFELTPAIDRTKTVTLTISSALVGDRFASDFQVCYVSNATFTDRFGNIIPPGSAGLLPDCGFEGGPLPPCVSQRVVNEDGSVSVSFVAPDNDPKGHI